MHVHLTHYVYSTALPKLHVKHGCSCMTLCVFPSHHPSGPSPWLKCVHVSVPHSFIPLTSESDVLLMLPIVIQHIRLPLQLMCISQVLYPIYKHTFHIHISIIYCSLYFHYCIFNPFYIQYMCTIFSIYTPYILYTVTV